MERGCIPMDGRRAVGLRFVSVVVPAHVRPSGDASDTVSDVPLGARLVRVDRCTRSNRCARRSRSPAAIDRGSPGMRPTAWNRTRIQAARGAWRLCRPLAGKSYTHPGRARRVEALPSTRRQIVHASRPRARRGGSPSTRSRVGQVPPCPFQTRPTSLADHRANATTTPPPHPYIPTSPQPGRLTARAPLRVSAPRRSTYKPGASAPFRVPRQASALHAQPATRASPTFRSPRRPSPRGDHRACPTSRTTCAGTSASA
jgi:hypothetical protein